MTPAQKKELVDMLREALAAADKYSKDLPGASGRSFCYGYLIGTINKTIRRLEN
jgi:hypothetical protein